MEDLGVISNVLQQDIGDSLVFKIIVTILLPIVSLLLPLIWNHVTKIPQEKQKTFYIILEKVFFPILDLQDKYYGIFRDKKLTMQNFHSLNKELIDLFERNSRIIPNYYKERLARIKNNNKEKEIKELYNDFFLTVSFESERLTKKLGYLSDNIGKRLLVSIKSKLVLGFISFCGLICFVIWLFLALFCFWKDEYLYFFIIIGSPIILIFLFLAVKTLERRRKNI